MVHLIFVVKYRKKILYGEIKDDIKQFLYETCEKHHWYIKKMVSTLKSYSTYHIWERHKPIFLVSSGKNIHSSRTGYFACSNGEVSQETIEHYIENQG